jgi:hypothetical protein
MHQKGESMVASDIRIAVGDRAHSISVLRAALVFILALAAMSAQPGKRRVNPIPVGFTPMPAATALY